MTRIGRKDWAARLLQQAGCAYQAGPALRARGFCASPLYQVAEKQRHHGAERDSENLPEFIRVPRAATDTHSHYGLAARRIGANRRHLDGGFPYAPSPGCKGPCHRTVPPSGCNRSPIRIRNGVASIEIVMMTLASAARSAVIS